MLTVNSASPATGVAVTVSPADNNGSGNGSTPFTRTYNAGTAVVLTAPAMAGANSFSAWTGCSTTIGTTCKVTLQANTTVSVAYAAPAGATYYVSGTGNDSNDGLSTATAFLTLQHAAG